MKVLKKVLTKVLECFPPIGSVAFYRFMATLCLVKCVGYFAMGIYFTNPLFVAVSVAFYVLYAMFYDQSIKAQKED